MKIVLNNASRGSLNLSFYTVVHNDVNDGGVLSNVYDLHFRADQCDQIWRFVGLWATF